MYKGTRIASNNFHDGIQACWVGGGGWHGAGFHRAWLKHNLDVKGWNYHVHREFPGHLESTILGRDHLLVGGLGVWQLARATAHRLSVTLIACVDGHHSGFVWYPTEAGNTHISNSCRTTGFDSGGIYGHFVGTSFIQPHSAIFTLGHACAARSACPCNIHCYAMLCYNATLHYTTLFYTILYYTILQYDMIWYNMT